LLNAYGNNENPGAPVEMKIDLDKEAIAVAAGEPWNK
jgi:hypothetical protein